MKRLLIRSLIFPLAMFLGGCSIYYDINYVPRPGYSEVPSTQPQQMPPPVTAAATIVGVRHDDSDNHIPPSVEVRLRIQNNGPGTVVFDPRSMELINSELMRFSPPLLQGTPPVTLTPQQATTVNTFFPFPNGYVPENTDLGSLQLQWQVQVDGKPISQVVNFHRWVPREYYDPYWDYPPPYVGYYGPGVVFIHRR